MSPDSLKNVADTLRHARHARVLLVGDVMVDRYWRGQAGRVSPEAPVIVVRVDDQHPRAGGAANVAANVAGLGSQARMLGLVGEDEAARELETILSDRQVVSHLIRVPHARTITKLRVIARQQQLIRLDFEDDFKAQDLVRLHEEFGRHLSDCDVVVLSDYAKGTLGQVQALISAARASGKPVIVDPKGVDFSRYRQATLITPNLSEFQAVVGRCDGVTDIETRARALCHEHAFQAVLVTRGEHGVSLVPAAGPCLHLPALAREVYDVTGAGDTVVATLAVALGVGERMETAVALANVAASIVVGKLGTDIVTPEELYRALEDHRGDQPRGVLDESQLRSAIAAARSRGERVVMTNGCFDLLHPGHLSYLSAARRLGDRLVVAVNDDASVSRLKGPSRPVNDLNHRMAMLAGLEAVDWVVPFSEDTPERLISAVLPDLLVKGGDYRPSEVAGGEAVIAAGGEVKILPFVDGHSSTKIIERIKGSHR
jgi:D-beta-D-heptose 7-phosphate kinase / D-beta-D-heptose 1-phosphate adenosyltransferase